MLAQFYLLDLLTPTTFSYRRPCQSQKNASLLYVRAAAPMGLCVRIASTCLRLLAPLLLLVRLPAVLLLLPVPALLLLCLPAFLGSKGGICRVLGTAAPACICRIFVCILLQLVLCCSRQINVARVSQSQEVEQNIRKLLTCSRRQTDRRRGMLAWASLFFDVDYCASWRRVAGSRCVHW